jgi:pilus assembly protein CpaB
VLALALLAVAVFASYLLLQRFRPAPVAEAEEEEIVVKTSVVVLTRDLSLGDLIKDNDIQLVEAPVDIVPRNALTRLDEAVDRIVKSDLVQGEILLASNLANPTMENNDLAFILSEDHVLMAFPADDLMSTESMIERGDIIDIFATFDQEIETIGELPTTEGEEQEPETRTFTVDTLQKVSVTALVLEVIGEEENTGNAPLGLETGEEAEEAPEPETRIRAYLLALPPQEALILKHLKDTGAIFDIVLRAPTSRQQFDLTPVTAEYIIELYGLEILP